MKHYYPVMAILLCTAHTLAMSQDNCKLKKDDDGIKVYTCEESDSKFKSLRVETSLQGVTLDELKSFILDAENYINWQYNMIESKKLQHINDHEIIVRSVIHAPWPVTNREMITHVNVAVRQSRGELTMVIKSIPFEYPLEKGLVRVPFSEATWHVKGEHNDQVTVQYFLRIDPGGSVPSWLVNIAMAEGPYSTFKNLKQQLSTKSK
jgi:hypothetical protein